MRDQATLRKAAVMSTRPVCFFALLALALSGCGSGNPTPTTIQRSALVLTSPPTTCSVGEIGAWSWDATSDDDEIWFDGNGGQESTIEVPGVGVLCARLIEKNDVIYLLAGVIRADESFALYRYHDSNADEAPDQSTETLLFSTGIEEAYVTSFSIGADGRAFALDRRCQDILLITDANTDGWPDSLQMVPFAKSADFTELLDARFLLAHSTSVVGAYLTEPHISVAAESQAVTKYEDTNADNVADTTEVSGATSLNPRATLRPYAGQTSVDLYADLNAVGKLAQVWKLDSSGSDVAMLGSVTLTGTDGRGIGTAPLSPALVLGDRVAFRFAGEAGNQMITEVVEAWPQIRHWSPPAVYEGVATTLTVYGANFQATMTLKLMKPDGSLQTQAFTLVNDGEMTVALPAMNTTTFGKRLGLWAAGAGQDDEADGAFAVSIPIKP